MKGDAKKHFVTQTNMQSSIAGNPIQQLDSYNTPLENKLTAAEKMKIRRCILVGINILIGITIAFVALGLYVFPDAILHPTTSLIMLILTIISFIFLLYIIYKLITGQVMSKSFLRTHFFITTLLFMLVLATQAHKLESPAFALLCLLVSFVLILIAAEYGFKAQWKDIQSWIMPLAVTTFVILLFSFINIFFLRTKILQIITSILLILLFTAFTVYNANAYTNGDCLYNCCEEGVFEIYYNFAQIAHSLFSIFSD